MVAANYAVWAPDTWKKSCDAVAVHRINLGITVLQAPQSNSVSVSGWWPFTQQREMPPPQASAWSLSGTVAEEPQVQRQWEPRNPLPRH
ncbi:MAG: hypothetical protein PHW10_05550 [Candidatus Peribacteraceae bacterium]|nr:hypothetical protein [Candidatus Peribacteraceae bacterium]